MSETRRAYRPYFRSTTKDLERLVDTRQHDAPTLVLIADELQHRRLPRSKRLARRVSGLLHQHERGNAPKPLPSAAAAGGMAEWQKFALAGAGLLIAYRLLTS